MLTCTFPASPIRCASYGALGSCEGRFAGLPARPARTSAAATRPLARAGALARPRPTRGRRARAAPRRPRAAAGSTCSRHATASRPSSSGSMWSGVAVRGVQQALRHAGALRQRVQPGRQRAMAMPPRDPHAVGHAQHGEIGARDRERRAADDLARVIAARPARERARGLGDGGERRIRGRRGRIIQGTHPATYRRVVPCAIGAPRRSSLATAAIRLYRARVARANARGEGHLGHVREQPRS